MNTFFDATQMCTGCGLCQAVYGPENVELKHTRAGALTPVFHVKTPGLSEFLFYNCPGLNQTNVERQTVPAIDDVIWGGYQALYTACSAEREIRHNGSSGGVITGFAKFLLEKQLVDFVVGTRVSEGDPLALKTVAIRDPEQVISLGGSRYYPSSPLCNILSLMKENDGKCLFIGRPCDVRALKRFIADNESLSARFLLFVSFFCAGTPTKTGTLAILNKFGVNEESLQAFRYRGDGWPGYATAVTQTGASYKMSYQDSWNEQLSPHVLWRCRLCPDGVGEAADLVCADAWHVKDNKLSFLESDGQSLVLVRTSIAGALLTMAIEEKAITLLATKKIEDLKVVQFHQWYRKVTILYRFAATKMMRQPFPQYNYWRLLRAATDVSFFAGIRTMVGTILRLNKKKYDN